MFNAAILEKALRKVGKILKADTTCMSIIFKKC